MGECDKEQYHIEEYFCHPSSDIDNLPLTVPSEYHQQAQDYSEISEYYCCISGRPDSAISHNNRVEHHQFGVVLHDLVGDGLHAVTLPLLEVFPLFSGQVTLVEQGLDLRRTSRPFFSSWFLGLSSLFGFFLNYFFFFLLLLLLIGVILRELLVHRLRHLFDLVKDIKGTVGTVLQEQSTYECFWITHGHFYDNLNILN